MRFCAEEKNAEHTLAFEGSAAADHPETAVFDIPDIGFGVRLIGLDVSGHLSAMDFNEKAAIAELFFCDSHFLMLSKWRG